MPVAEPHHGTPATPDQLRGNLAGEEAGGYTGDHDVTFPCLPCIPMVTWLWLWHRLVSFSF
jgi:hypothetical protein